MMLTAARVLNVVLAAGLLTTLTTGLAVADQEVAETPSSTVIVERNYRDVSPDRAAGIPTEVPVPVVTERPREVAPDHAVIETPAPVVTRVEREVAQDRGAELPAVTAAPVAPVVGGCVAP